MITDTDTIRAAPSAVTAPSPLLSVRNIEVVYDDVILVLRGLSLEVPQGAIVALLGANGAGKSTTLKAISGLLKTEDGEVTRGEIVFDGERINGIDPDKIVRRGIFQVMEGRRIIADMTSLENLRLGAFTRSDNEVGADIDMVYKYFPRLKERTGRAGDGLVAAAGKGSLRDHQGDQPRSWRHHPAGGAERARRVVGREPRLHHGARQGGTRWQRRRATRQRRRQGVLPRGRRRPAQEFQEFEKLQTKEAVAVKSKSLLVVPGRATREPGTSRFRVWSCGPSRNGGDDASSGMVTTR